MRINLGAIGKLNEQSTKSWILELLKNNPELTGQYERIMELLTDNKSPNVNALLELVFTENINEEITELIPKRTSQKIAQRIWDEYTPNENKLELIDGDALWGGEQRDKML